jgi:hypothetical protein
VRVDFLFDMEGIDMWRIVVLAWWDEARVTLEFITPVMS